MQESVLHAGNLLVDLTVEEKDSALAELKLPGLTKGGSILVDDRQCNDLLDRYGDRVIRKTPAGSAANTALLFSALGGHAALEARIGYDDNGLLCQKDFGRRFHVVLTKDPILGGRTGLVFCLVSEDGERTMPCFLGEAANFGKSDELARHIVRRYDWLFYEAYLYGNSPRAMSAVRRAIRDTKNERPPYRTKVAATLGCPEIVNAFHDAIVEDLEHVDLLFTNRSEVLTLTGARDFDRAREAAKGLVANYVITDGPRGAYIWWRDKNYCIEPAPGERRDATGAGDNFAAGVMSGITRGKSPQIAGDEASELGALTVQQYGARLPAEIVAAFREKHGY